jgi:Protein of unknown function (DUF4038)/Putative collagen-binding domain of a collagenase
LRHLASGLVFVSVFALVACSSGTPQGGSPTGDSRNNTEPVRLMPPPSYPLRAGPTQRYLVDRKGLPFLIVGDSPQALVVNVSLPDADKFMADRAATGFNSLWVNLLCNTYTGGRSDGTTFDKLAPFSTPGDLANPNEAYFRRADAVIRLAAKHGLTVLLDPIETGGWLGTLLDNGVKKDYAFGKWLGNRYKSFPNIIWFNGNDFQQYQDPTANAVVFAVARGIRATDKSHIHTVELDNFRYGSRPSGSRDSRLWTPLIGLDAAYTYYPTYAQVLKEYNRPDHIPVFMVEANYEFEHDYSGPETLRRQEYWSLLSGASGQLYGNKYTWQFIDGWKDHLDTTGVTELQYITKLVADRPWFKLVPDQRHKLVTAGFGSFSSSGSVNDNDYVTAAKTPDGKLAIAYLPTGHTITVDLGRLKGRVKAQWYDPTTGMYTVTQGSPLANSRKRDFTPPSHNAAGDNDWVLVLTAA